MAYKTIPAVYGLNRVLWASIVQSGIIPNTSNYNGLIPIIPIQEEPQFISAMEGQSGIMSWPYIVYNWYQNGIDAKSWYKQTDTVTYTIYAIDQTALRQLVLLTTELFKRYDDSAAVVNRYLAQAYPPPTPLPDNWVDGPTQAGYEYRCYNYNYIFVSSANAGSPSSENDPNKATITLRVNYTDTRNDSKLIVPPLPQ